MSERVVSGSEQGLGPAEQGSAEQVLAEQAGDGASWDGLKDEVPFQEQNKTEEHAGKSPEKLMERAKLYRQFGKVALALTAMEENSAIESADAGLADAKSEVPDSAAEQSDTKPETMESPEDTQAEALITQLENALDDVDRSLANQIDANIVNHKQINTKDALEHELASGSSIPELDIRFDKDGKPWISHSPRAGARFFFSKPIHKLSSKEVADYGERLSLEEGLDIFEKYKQDNDNHKVVLEIKELGAAPEQHQGLLDGVKDMLEERGLTDSTIFATLSPSILRSIHDAFPENSKILNGGIAPVISYDLAKKSLSNDAQEKEFAVKLPNVELFFSNSTEIHDHADGYGKQTGYLWTRLPKETVDALSALNKDGKTGAASLTVVNKFANVLDKLSPKTAESLRHHYAEQLDSLGIRKQVAISKKNPLESLKRTKAQMGEDAIIYSDTSPGDWAAEL